MREHRRLARYALWNILSLVAPMLVALATIPALIQALGTDRFGVLTLAWMLIGYCSLFDLGLGRALTKLVSEETAAALPGTVWTALALMLALGCVGAGLFAVFTAPLAHTILKAPGALRSETAASLYWIAAAIPLVTLTAGLRGILEGRQQFGYLSAIRALTGALTFVGPLMGAKLWGSLPVVVFSIVAVRLLSLGAHAALCMVMTPDLLADRRLRLEQIRPLFRFGGWLTVSNVLSPLMVSLDRFLIGMFLSATSLAYYATPYEIVSKLLVVPAAVTGVLFPAFTTALVSDLPRARLLYAQGLGAIVGLVAPVSVLMIFFAHAGLRLWLGAEFASHGSGVMQLLAIGVLITSAANVPCSFLQACGRPDINAKLHMVEFPLYVPAVYFLMRAYGIEGAALAWVLRASLDAVLLFWIAGRRMSTRAPARWEAVIA